MQQQTHFSDFKANASTTPDSPSSEFDGLRLPAAVGHQVATSLEYHEELREIDWMAPLIKGADVMHIGCGIGLWTARLADHCHRVVGYDACNEHATITKQVLVLNGRQNATVTTALDPEDLSFADVIIADLTRPTPHLLLNAILTTSPSQTIVLSGGWSTNALKRLLDAGYRHRTDLPRAAVFQKIMPQIH